jgi:CTP-dependent riboflavin kinase
LYPNPNAGNMTITQSLVNDGLTAVKVVNYLGATVYNGTLNFANGKAELNMTDIVSGMYLVQINDGNGGVQTFKMVVEK